MDFCSNGKALRKEANNELKDWNKNGLKLSASRYADHAENRILELQQGYSRKYQPQQYASSANVSPSLQDVPRKRFASGMSNPFRSWWEDKQETAKATSSEEGMLTSPIRSSLVYRD